MSEPIKPLLKDLTPRDEEVLSRPMGEPFANEPLVPSETRLQTMESLMQGNTLEEERIILDQERRQSLETQVRETLEQPLPEQDRLERIKTLVDTEESQPPPKKSDLFVRNRARNAETSAFGAGAKEALLEKVEDVQQHLRDIDKIQKGVGLDLSSAYNEQGHLNPDFFFTDFLPVVFAPGTFGVPIANVVNDVFPDEVGALDYVFAGSLLRRVKERLLELPVEERAAKMKALQNSLKEQELLGFIDNDFMRWDVSQVLFDDLEDGFFEEQLNNFFSVLDISIFASTARGGFKGIQFLGKGIKKLFKEEPPAPISTPKDRGRISPTNSIINTLNQTDPNAARQALIEVLEDPSGALARSMGLDPADIGLEYHLPKSDSTIIPGPSLSENERIGAILFSPDELEMARLGLDERIKEAEKLAVSGKSVISKYTGVEVREDGLVGRITVQADDTSGFSTLRQAQAAARGYKEIIGNGEVRYLIRDHRQGEFIPIEEYRKKYGKIKGKNEYIFDFEYADVFSSKYASDLIGPRGVVTGEGVTGWLAKHFDKDSWAQPWLVRAMAAASDQNSRRLKILRNTLQPMTRLDIKEQEKVLEVLQEGADTETWFSRRDLITMWAGEASPKTIAKRIKAYEAVRRHQDKVYEYINEGVYRRLAGKGIKEISVRVGNTSVRMLGKAVEHLPTSITRIYDPALGKARDISLEEIRALNKEGKGFISFSSPYRTGAEEINFSLPGKNVKIKELPPQVLRRTDGYITRIYDAAFVVRQNSKVRIDGGVPVDRGRVVGIESNPSSAKDLLNQLKEDAIARGEDPNQYELFRADEIKAPENYYDPYSLEYLLDTGQLYTSSRGPEIFGKRVDVTDKRRRVLAPLRDAIMQGQTKAARAGTIDLAVDKLMTNWMALYGERFGRTTAKGGKSFPWFGPLSDETGMVANSQALADATAFRDQIKLAAGVSESFARERVQQQIIRFTEAFMNSDKRWARYAADATFATKDAFDGMINSTKAIAFFQLITARPVRQALLQSLQMTMYLGRDGATKYVASGKGIRDLTALYMGMGARSIGAMDGEMGKTFARYAGMSHTEYKRFIEAYVESGLPDAIDSHVWTEMHAVTPELARQGSSAVGRKVEQSRLATRQLMRFLRRVGFDVGEQAQLAAAFLTERNAWQRANPKIAHKWDERKNLLEIATAARGLSLNMNSLGALGFQRGVLSPVFQFMSHTTKSLQMAIPARTGVIPGLSGTKLDVKIPGLSKLANKRLNEIERRKMLIWQMAIFGTKGYGLAESIDAIFNFVEDKSGEPIPDDVKMTAEEGVFGTLVNMAIRLSEDDEVWTLGERDLDTTTMDVSQNMSPLGGSFGVQNPVGKLYEVLFLSSPELWKLAGPGVDTMSRMLGNIPTLGHILGRADYLDTDERIEAAAVAAISTVLLAASDYQKMRFEQAIGAYMSRRGNIGTDATNTEVLMKYLLSVQTKTETDLREFSRDITGVYGGFAQEPSDEAFEIQNDAKATFEQIQKTLVLAGKGDISRDEFETLVKQHGEFAALRYSDNENDALIFQAELQKRLTEWGTEVIGTREGFPVYELEAAKIMARVYENTSIDYRETIINRIRQMPPFPQQELLLEKFEEALQ